MLAFLDSPVQLIAVAVVLLIVFGPNKLPEILGQLGKAMREFRRYTSDLSSTFHSSYYDSSYQPTRYDSYGNPIPENNEPNNSPPSTYSPPYGGMSTYSAYSSCNEPPKGDMAAPALAPSEEEATQGQEISVSKQVSSPASGITVQPAEGSVPRS